MPDHGLNTFQDKEKIINNTGEKFEDLVNIYILWEISEENASLLYKRKKWEKCFLKKHIHQD